MTITLPGQYHDRFEAGAYLTRWKDYSLLLLTRKEHGRFLAGSEKLIKVASETDRQFLRLLEAGLVEMEIRNGRLELTGGFATWLKGNKRTFELTERGLLVR